MRGAMMNVTAIVMFGMTGLGCQTSQTEPVAAPVAEGLTITQHDSDQLLGTFGHGEAKIRFAATQDAEGDAQLALSIGAKRFAYEGSALREGHRGWFRVTADHVLDASDIGAAQALLDAVSVYLGTEASAVSLHEASVPKMALWITQHPAGQLAESLFRNEYYEHEPRAYSLNNDGVTCIRRNTNVTAYYDRSSGQSYSQSVAVGSDWGTSACGSGGYSCMGRCGAGCNGFGGGWTLDCLEHDVCSHNLCASGGGGDANCGDEYNHSTGDIFSSCSGN